MISDRSGTLPLTRKLIYYVADKAGHVFGQRPSSAQSFYRFMTSISSDSQVDSGVDVNEIWTFMLFVFFYTGSVHMT